MENVNVVEFPAPREGDRELYPSLPNTGTASSMLGFPAPLKVDRYLYFRRGHRMKRFIAI